MPALSEVHSVQEPASLALANLRMNARRGDEAVLPGDTGTRRSLHTQEGAAAEGCLAPGLAIQGPLTTSERGHVFGFAFGSSAISRGVGARKTRSNGARNVSTLQPCGYVREINIFRQIHYHRAKICRNRAEITLILSCRGSTVITLIRHSLEYSD